MKHAIIFAFIIISISACNDNKENTSSSETSKKPSKQAVFIANNDSLFGFSEYDLNANKETYLKLLNGPEISEVVKDSIYSYVSSIRNNLKSLNVTIFSDIEKIEIKNALESIHINNNYYYNTKAIRYIYAQKNRVVITWGLMNEIQCFLPDTIEAPTEFIIPSPYWHNDSLIYLTSSCLQLCRYDIILFYNKQECRYRSYDEVLTLSENKQVIAYFLSNNKIAIENIFNGRKEVIHIPTYNLWVLQSKTKLTFKPTGVLIEWGEPNKKKSECRKFFKTNLWK